MCLSVRICVKKQTFVGNKNDIGQNFCDIYEEFQNMTVKFLKNPEFNTILWILMDIFRMENWPKNSNSLKT